MSDPKIIPLDPASNSKTDEQGNKEESSITIENPDAPVNLDESIAPPVKNVEISNKDGDRFIENPTEGEL